MCKDCGCEHANHVHGHRHVDADGREYRHNHNHNHNHEHSVHEHSRKIMVEQAVLSKNDSIARENRQWLDHHHITAFNLMSSPGAGKTTLLKKTLELLPETLRPVVLVGDQETDLDAARLRTAGKPAKQINTHSSCHLDAAMIARELGSYIDEQTNMLLIENVGNLVCPAAFDLGEHVRVAVLSVTEGEDKPVKYPVLFNNADAVVITKTDLLPHLDWNREQCHTYIRKSGSRARIIEISARTGEGMDVWIRYLQSMMRHE